MPIKTSKEKTSELQKALNVMDKDIQNLLIGEKVDSVIIKKILALGEPFRKIMRVLGKDKSTNPILGFILQEYVQKNLLATNKLNAQTFKALYNAVAKKLVVDSEFFKDNDYNIIYCLDLYNKSPAEMEAYLELQGALDVSKLKFTDKVYTDVAQAENKQAFIATNISKAPAILDRAAEIKAAGIEKFEKVSVKSKNAKLNSIELAKAILGAKPDKAIALNDKEQDNIVKELNDLAKMFVTLLSISLSTKSQKARETLAKHRNKFTGISSDKIIEATLWLAQKSILPKGQIQKHDADALVDKLGDKLAVI